MNRLLYSAWDGELPRVHAISYALPGTPHLTLTGGSITNMPLDKYLNDLERDIHNQSGAYFAYVWGNYNSEDEAEFIPYRPGKFVDQMMGLIWKLLTQNP